MAVRNLGGRLFAWGLMPTPRTESLLLLRRTTLALRSNTCGASSRWCSAVSNCLSYCIDTNVFIDAGARYYRPDIVPGFWENFDALIGAGRMKAPEMLIEELHAKTTNGASGSMSARKTMAPMDLSHIEAMQKVMATYTAQGIDANRITGDPFFIALALANDLTVVTNEKPRRGGAKIPKICAALGVPSIGLLEFMRRESWRLVAN